MSTLQDHQRYFPVRSDAGLLPYFIATSNLESKAPEEVLRGNERVVLPRLADAEFFWKQDLAVPLAGRQDALATCIYQQGLGQPAGQGRPGEPACAACSRPAWPRISERSGGPRRWHAPICLRRWSASFPSCRAAWATTMRCMTANLKKSRLRSKSNTCRAMPAIVCRPAPVGQALGIADRLDTLAGIFALGKRPSGNKDPFGLRRQALGLLRILIECGIDVDLRALLAAAVELQPLAQKDSGTADELFEFVLERLRTWYLAGQAPDLAEGAVSSEMFDAVRARAPASPLDFHQRLLAVQQFASIDDAASLAAANKRIANLLRKSAEEAEAQTDAATLAAEIDPDLFGDAEERALYDSVRAVLPEHAADLEQRNYPGRPAAAGRIAPGRGCLLRQSHGNGRRSEAKGQPAGATPPAARAVPGCRGYFCNTVAT